MITPSGEVTILQGDSLLLSSSPAEGYLWSTGAGTQEIYVSAAGSYSVQAVSAQGCTGPSSDPVDVVVSNLLPKPTVSVSGSTELCEGQSVGLTGETASSWLWSTGETTQSITVNASGSYSLVITNASGVRSLESDPVTVHVYPNPEPSIQYEQVSCPGGSNGTATVTVTKGLAPFTFEWSDGQTGQTLGGMAAGDYTVTVTDARSCSGSAAVTIDQPADSRCQRQRE